MKKPVTIEDVDAFCKIIDIDILPWQKLLMVKFLNMTPEERELLRRRRGFGQSYSFLLSELYLLKGAKL